MASARRPTSSLCLEGQVGQGAGLYLLFLRGQGRAWRLREAPGVLGGGGNKIPKAHLFWHTGVWRAVLRPVGLHICVAGMEGRGRNQASVQGRGVEDAMPLPQPGK